MAENNKPSVLESILSSDRQGANIGSTGNTVNPSQISNEGTRPQRSLADILATEQTASQPVIDTPRTLESILQTDTPENLPTTQVSPDLGDDSFAGDITRNAEEVGKSLAGGLAQSIGDTLQGSVRLGEALFGDNLGVQDSEVFKAGAAVKDFSEKNFSIDPAEADKISNIVAQGLGQAVGFIGGGAAASAATAAVGGTAGAAALASTLTSILIGTASVGNQQAEDYLNTVKNPDELDAQAVFALTAPLGSLESLPMVRAASRVNKATGGLFTKLIGKKGGKFLSGKAGKVLGSTLDGALEEGVTETLQTLAGNLIASDVIVYDKDRKAFSGVAESGEAGAATGAALNLLLAAIPGRAGKAAPGPQGKFEAVETSQADVEGEITIKTPEQTLVDSIQGETEKDIVTPINRQEFISPDVKKVFAEGAKLASIKFNLEESGQDTTLQSSAIQGRADAIKELIAESEDAGITAEGTEAVEFLETIANKSQNTDAVNILDKEVLGEAADDIELTPVKSDQINALKTELGLDITTPISQEIQIEAPLTTPEAADFIQEIEIPDVLDNEDSGKRERKGLRAAVDALPDADKDRVITDLRAQNKELTQRLYTSEVAGIPNKAAFTDAPRKQFIASIDIDSLKFLNDSLGHQGGDDLIRKVAQAINSELPGSTFHVSGDEIVAQHDNNVALDLALRNAQESLKTQKISGTDITSEQRAVQNGLAFTYGIDTDLAAADAVMLRTKEQKNRQGLRAARGEAPAGFELLPAAEHVDIDVVEEIDIEGAQDLTTLDDDLANLDAEIVALRQDPLADPEELASMRKRSKELRNVQKNLKAITVPDRTVLDDGDTISDESTGDLILETFRDGNIDTETVSTRLDVTDDGIPTPTNPNQIQDNKSAVDLFKNKLNAETIADLDVNTVDTFNDLSSADRKNLKGVGAKAIYRTNNKTGKGTLTFIADRFSSRSDVIRTALHEVVGHHGLRKILPGQQYDQLLRRVLNMSPGVRQDILSKTVRWKKYLQDWEAAGGDINSVPASAKETFTTVEGGKIEIPNSVALKLADEYMAELAKQRLTSKSFVETALGGDALFRRNTAKINAAFDRVLKAIRHTLRKVFGDFTSDFTVDDINAAIAKSSDTLFRDTSVDFSGFATTEDVLAVDALPSTEFQATVTPEARAEAERMAKEQGVSEIDIVNVVNMATAQDATTSSLTGHAIGTKFYNKVADSMRKSRAFKVFTHMGSLPNSRAYDMINNLVFAKHDQVDSFLKGSQSAFQNLSDIQLKQSTQFMRTSGADINTVQVPSETREFLVEAKQKIEDLGQILTDNGFLSESTFEENRGGYLVTLYAKYMKETKLSNKRTSFLNWAKKKKDIPTEIQAELGKIEDPELLIAETVGTMSHDAGVLELFKTVKEVSEDQGLMWVMDNDKKVSYDRLVSGGTQSITKTISELESDKKRLEFSLRENIKDIEGGFTDQEIGNLETNIARITTAIEEGKVSMRQDLQEEAFNSAVASGEINAEGFNPATYVQDNYRQVPNKTRYGALAGKFIRNEIYTDLVSSSEALKADGISGKTWNVLKAANREWKFLKAVGSPAQVVRNFGGNLALLDIASRRNSATLVNWASQGVYSRILNEDTEWSQIHDSIAGKSTSLLDNEFEGISKRRQDIIRDRIELEGTKGKIAQKMKLMGNLYSLYQEVGGNVLTQMERGSKDAAVRDFLETWNETNGRDFRAEPVQERQALFAQAVEHANSVLFDYGAVPDLVQSLRRSPVGSPFLTYTYKAVPAYIKGSLNNPHKLAQQLAIPALVTQMALTMLDEFSDEEQETLINRLPEWHRAFGSTMFIPVRDSDGTPQFVDISYLSPISIFSKSIHNMVVGSDDGSGSFAALQGIRETATETLGIFGGAFVNTTVALLSNQDGLGRPIYKKHDRPHQKWLSFTTAAWDLAAPTMLTSSGPLRKMAQAISGDIPQTRGGQPKFTFGQAAGSFAGFSFKKFDEENLRRSAIGEFNARDRELVIERGSILRDRSLGPQDRAEALRFLATRKRAFLQARNKRLGITPKGDI